MVNDKAIVIKNLQNYMDTYEYTWEKPGIYEVVFVGTNSDYISATSEIKTITVYHRKVLIKENTTVTLFLRFHVTAVHYTTPRRT